MKSGGHRSILGRLLFRVLINDIKIQFETPIVFCLLTMLKFFVTLVMVRTVNSCSQTLTCVQKWYLEIGMKINVGKIMCVPVTRKTKGITKIMPISVEPQLNSIYFIELHVSTYFRSSSGSQFFFKTY
jgi:hypothetical protein